MIRLPQTKNSMKKVDSATMKMKGPCEKTAPQQRIRIVRKRKKRSFGSQTLLYPVSTVFGKQEHG
jgi:hypothetical protein